MPLFHNDKNPADQKVGNNSDQPEHKAKLSHELVAGAAAYEATQAYENHKKKNDDGKPVDHAQAKKILVGLAGAFADHEAETKGLDFIDKQKAKHEAKKEAKNHDDATKPPQ